MREKRREFETHGGARKLQRRRYVKKRSGARESKETEAEADQLTAQALFLFPDGVFLQSNVPIGATDRAALQTSLTRAPGAQTLRLHPPDFVDSDGVIETFWGYFA